MSLRKLVKRQVKQAFKAIGDLKVTVVFRSRVVSTYDFGTMSNTILSRAPIILNGVLSEKRSKPNGTSLEKPPEASIFFIKEEVDTFGGLASYDELEKDGEIWRIVPPIKDDGFLVEVAISREGSL